MPLFDYKCECGAQQIDRMFGRFADAPEFFGCPDCGIGVMQRQIGRTAFLLKGGGWAQGGYVKEVTRHGSVTTTVEGDTRILK